MGSCISTHHNHSSPPISTPKPLPNLHRKYKPDPMQKLINKHRPHNTIGGLRHHGLYEGSDDPEHHSGLIAPCNTSLGQHDYARGSVRQLDQYDILHKPNTGRGPGLAGRGWYTLEDPYYTVYGGGKVVQKPFVMPRRGTDYREYRHEDRLEAEWT